LSGLGALGECVAVKHDWPLWARRPEPMFQRLQSPTAQRALVYLFFALFLGIGLAVYRDYGISCDEEIARYSVGVVSYRYVVGHDKGPLLDSGDRFHGPSFELLLVVVEEAFHLKDLRDIYLARHLVTFLLFFASVVVFYRVLRRRFRSRVVGLTGALFLILSPRIFAESFYNCKDLAFMSAFVLALATLGRFVRDMNYRNALLHGLASGFMVDIRLPGLVLPAITLALAVGIWIASIWHPPSVRVRPLPLATYVVALCGFTFLFWPLLWLKPFVHFRQAWENNSNYPCFGFVFYMGEQVRNKDLPWHYLPVWILITTPLLYTGLFILGIGRLAGSLCLRPLRLLAEQPADLGFLLALVVPLAAIIGLHSTVYDGWRHVYFVYPAFLFLSVLGLVTLHEALKRLTRSAPAAACICLLLTALPLTATAVTMVRDHPHQYVYFNRLAGRDLKQAGKRFELDYWGLSYREAYEYIVRNDPSPAIRVCSGPDFNKALLRPRDRARLIFTKGGMPADYVVSHYRFHKRKLPTDNNVYALKMRGAEIVSVQKVR
jgi:hypothetical protein